MQKDIGICFYGASVSEQSGSGGYVSCLTNLLKERLGSSINFYFSKITFPSAHFNDAGFMHVDSIVSVRPSFVFLDWLSTGDFEFDESKLRYVLTRLLRKAIYPIMLDLPRADSIQERRLNSCQVKNMCEEMRIPYAYIDITEQVIDEAVEIANITRDGVHTTEYGASFYANIIFDHLSKLLEMDNPFVGCRFNVCDESNYLINKTSIGKEYILERGAKMLVKVDLPTRRNKEYPIEIWANQRVGTHSPIIEISCEPLNYFTEYSVWDIWCHYDRLAFKPLIPKIQIPNDEYKTLLFEVQISQSKPNYPDCRRENISFPSDLQLVVTDYFYTVNCSASVELL